ncbi:ankyrin repeat protein, putative [Trichomonas vaginalis G3]|uniref:Ankyrin repeat protein, putative n=1 Tax=Trichomonas vaginalis (strain ATCC PRA-98 / G3) TaxID=412133 RepID=A2G1F0_TRIV3|nr:protein ubiquitination [Trichomonas vaginalis G3]EAX89007.1 ankyrin repeat protein, putative [Trichomonas vaginalis G3]KAI5485783.1 protein ubiquitination [Trichomonas vaginalis G3]|eukprot:XP_001301937.1 ankyrin repeat protein [Trichomonas vaginalis G3]
MENDISNLNVLIEAIQRMYDINTSNYEDIITYLHKLIRDDILNLRNAHQIFKNIMLSQTKKINLIGYCIKKLLLLCQKDSNPFEANFIKKTLPNYEDVSETNVSVDFDLFNDDNKVKYIYFDDVDSLIKEIQDEEFDFIATYQRKSLIYYCANFGSTKCFKYLLANGATVDQTILEGSFLSGEIEIIHLLEEKLLPNYKCFQNALIAHNLDLIDYLISKYNFVLSYNDFATKYCFEYLFDVLNNEQTFLESLKNGLLQKCASLGIFPVVKIIVDKMYNVVTDKKNIISKISSSLICAIEKNNIKTVYFLLEKDVDINYINSDYMTPLQSASFVGNLDVVKILVQRGAIINEYHNKFTLTPLSRACFGGHLEIVKFLVENGAEVNQIKDNSTALVTACIHHNTDIALYLIEKGADVAKFDPFFWCASSGNTKVAEKILDKIEINENDDALITACRNNSLEMVKLLVSRGFNVNFKNIEGMTPFLTAVKINSVEIAKYLYEKGADIHVSTIDGFSVKEYAKANYSADVGKWLDTLDI